MKIKFVFLLFAIISIQLAYSKKLLRGNFKSRSLQEENDDGEDSTPSVFPTFSPNDVDDQDDKEGDDYIGDDAAEDDNEEDDEISYFPTGAPTLPPTESNDDEDENIPTQAPTLPPTEEFLPTSSPTIFVPSSFPTSQLTEASQNPTSFPTNSIPTSFPTIINNPTSTPTIPPSSSITEIPTSTINFPTSVPSLAIPSSEPTSAPTTSSGTDDIEIVPTLEPTRMPTTETNSNTDMDSRKKNKLKAGDVVGIIMACIFVLSVVAVMCSKVRSGRGYHGDSEEEEPLSLSMHDVSDTSSSINSRRHMIR